MEDEIRVPIYFMAGFLESGKSTFLDLHSSGLFSDGPTLLILSVKREKWNLMKSSLKRAEPL